VQSLSSCSPSPSSFCEGVENRSSMQPQSLPPSILMPKFTLDSQCLYLPRIEKCGSHRRTRLARQVARVILSLKLIQTSARVNLQRSLVSVPYQSHRLYFDYPDKVAPMSHPSDAAEKMISSTSAAPPAFPKADQDVLSYRPSEQPTSESWNPGADLDVTRLTHIHSSNTSAGPAALNAVPLANVETSTAWPQSPASEAQAEVPGLADALAIISRLGLSPGEREALAGSFALEVTTAYLARGDTMSSPPPYAR